MTNPDRCPSCGSEERGVRFYDVPGRERNACTDTWHDVQDVRVVNYGLGPRMIPKGEDGSYADAVDDEDGAPYVQDVSYADKAKARGIEGDPDRIRRVAPPPSPGDRPTTIETGELVKGDDSKLSLLADWFDQRDDAQGYSGPREVQDDLRRIARTLSTLQARIEELERELDEKENLRAHAEDAAFYNARIYGQAMTSLQEARGLLERIAIDHGWEGCEDDCPVMDARGYLNLSSTKETE